MDNTDITSDVIYLVGEREDGKGNVVVFGITADAVDTLAAELTVFADMVAPIDQVTKIIIFAEADKAALRAKVQEITQRLGVPM
jgi:hypothetical protein